MTANTIKVLQGVLCFTGITLGVIPLIMYLIRGAPGNVWRLLLDAPYGPVAWAGPIAVILAALALIVLLERGKDGSAA